MKCPECGLPGRPLVEWVQIVGTVTRRGTTWIDDADHRWETED